MFTRTKPRRAERRRNTVAISLVAALAAVAMTLGASLSLATRAGATLLSPRRVGKAPLVAGGAVLLGALPSTTSMKIDVVLYPRDPAALSSFATAVSTPGNSLYRHFLARGQFAGRFGPTEDAIAAVEGALGSDGLAGGRLSANHLSIEYTASAATLSKAFSIGFSSYRLPGGRVAFANSSAPELPGAAAPYVQGVLGLDDLTKAKQLGGEHVSVHQTMAAAPHVVTGGPQPCTAAKDYGKTQEAYTADQLASAYNFSSLYATGDEGAGVSVALFELEPNLTTDISEYQSCYGTSATVSYTQVDGGAGTGPGEGEAALDIEDVIGLAPKASIDVYRAPNTNVGLYDNYSAIVSNDTSQVISTSWGDCESVTGLSIISEEGTLFEEAAANGQSILAAAGDSGSEDCGTSVLAVDDPASQPYVTGVGGTELSAIGPAPTQKVWNEAADGLGAGGGGISAAHLMPSYQSGAPASLNVVNSLSSDIPCEAASGSYCREVPDVSADADPLSGYVIYYDGSWTDFGGTSAAAPLWAAFMALTDASSSCAGKTVGFANPALYSAAATAYAADFDDITSGNNDYTGTNSGLFPATTGYDMASGLGTPNGAGLPGALCGASSRDSATTTLTVTPGSPVVGQSVSFTATVAPVAPVALAPTGTVTIALDNDPVCTATLDGATPDRATCTAREATAGTYSVAAAYGGDSNFSSSRSAATSATFSPAATATSLAASVLSPKAGEEVTFAARVGVIAPGGGLPTGTVAFAAGRSKLCSGFLTGKAPDEATCKKSFAVSGTVDVTAEFAGSANYTGSVSTKVSESVTAADTKTSVSASHKSSVAGQAVTFRASVAAVAPSTGKPTGKVRFIVRDKAHRWLLCSGGDTKSLRSGTVSCQLPGKALNPSYSPLSVSASYEGTSGYKPSRGTVEHDIDRATTSVKLGASATRSEWGHAVTFTAAEREASPGKGALDVKVSADPAPSDLPLGPLVRGHGRSLA